MIRAGFYTAPGAHMRPDGRKSPHAVGRWADVH
jgi:hypothetical protein